MKIKKGDRVIILSGKDRGRTGKVLRSIPDREKVVVEGINVSRRHQRPKKSNEKGQILDKAMPIHVSNVKKIESSKKTKSK